MRKKTIILYKFNELKKDIKENVIEKNRYINVEFNQWDEPITEQIPEELSELGYKNANFYYSGFSSQGDGASFTATINVKEWLKGRGIAKKYALLANWCNKFYENGTGGFEITRSGGYYHEYSMTVEMPIDFDIDSDEELTSKQSSKLYNLANELSELIIEDARQEAKKLYKRLEKYYFELLEDEAVAETLEANDYEFTENGKLDN